MSLNIYTAEHRPTQVTAVNVTAENAEAVAEFLGEGASAIERYIPSPQSSRGIWEYSGVAIPNVGRAQLGDWIVVDGDTLQVFNPEQFLRAFNHLKPEHLLAG